LVTGEFEREGTLGNVGWNSVTAKSYEIPAGASYKWLRSIFWNQVPVVNSQNQYNFSNIDVAFTPGLPNGSAASRLKTDLTISRSVSERFRYGNDFVKTYRILNKECRAIEVNIKFGQLSATSKNPETAGDVTEVTVSYNIYTRPIYSTTGRNPEFSLKASENVRGKISFGYIKSTRVTLLSNNNDLVVEPDFLGWEVKVQRTTPDSIDLSTRNQTYIDSITEIYGDVFSYPNSAIVASKFSSEYFNQIPERSYDVMGMKVSVPDNYDPIFKTYDEGGGGWDGTFATSKKWTDNPAWCFYDLLTSRRYGLGKYIDPSYIDKWTLYQIGKYCDTLVSDGEGGLEPRFVCNLVLFSREEAYKVVNDFASIFRAITYYGAGAIYAVQDSLKTPMWQFTNANVQNGDFVYNSSSKKARHTVAMVRYNDKRNFYLPAVEYVEDVDGIRRYGIREVELTAYGCTSRGQAVRWGRWALLSETAETESVGFTCGAVGAYLRPGDIIQIADENRTVRRYGGRLHAFSESGNYLIPDSTATVTLDDEITNLQASNQYKLSILTPTFQYDPTSVTDLTSDDYANIRRTQIQQRLFQGSQAQSVVGSDGKTRTVISLEGADFVFDVVNYDVTGKHVWMIENSGAPTDLAYNKWEEYRVLNVKEEDDGVRYSVSALEYDSTKFLRIESGLGFEEPGYGAIPAGPSNLTLSLVELSANSKRIDYSFTQSNMESVNSFMVYAKKDSISDSDVVSNTYLIAKLPKSTTNGDFFPSQNGTYYFRVYSANAQGVKSTTYAANSILVYGVNPIKDVSINSLRLQGDTTTNAAGNRTYSTTDEYEPVFNWQVGLLQDYSIPGDYSFRVTFRAPSESNTPHPSIYAEITGYRSSDFNYPLTFDFNKTEFRDSITTETGPFRRYDVVVEAMTTGGDSSAGGNFTTSDDFDSDFDNPNGYDILGVYNPPISDFSLRIEDRTEDFATDQWISPDGDVKIAILSGTAPDDFAGAYIYTSSQIFTKEEAYGLIETTKDIRRFDVNEFTSNVLVANANYSELDEAYVALSMADEFDQANEEDGTEISDTLYMSQPVKIFKRGGAGKGEIFYAWVQVNFEALTRTPDWSTNYNIENLQFSVPDSTTSQVYNVTFKKPVEFATYVVLIGNPEPISDINANLRPIIITEKRVDGFKFRIHGNEYMKVFLGVIRRE
jgi:hypothetical protein